MLSQPVIEHQEALFYMAIRTKVNQKDIPAVLPPLLPQVYDWIRQHDALCDGPPFFLYRSMDNDNEVVAEAGVPVKEKAVSNEYVFSDALPAGLYATLIYTGDYRHMMDAHTALECWIRDHGYRVQHVTRSYGTLWGCRAEFYLNDPNTERDSSKWMTAIKLLVERL